MEICWILAAHNSRVDPSTLTACAIKPNWPLIDINAGVNLVAYVDLTEQENKTLSMEERQHIADNLLELCRIRWTR